MLVKHLKANTDRTKEEERALELVIKGGNYVSEENLAAVMAWYQR